MGYCNQNDLLAKISITDLLPFLDDQSSGSLNDAEVQARLASIIDVESALIDGSIANIYDVPISPAPPILRAACIIFCCETIYRRRLTPDEVNPFKSQADLMRQRLEDIGNGKVHLDLRNPRNFPQGTYVASPIAMNYTSL